MNGATRLGSLCTCQAVKQTQTPSLNLSLQHQPAWWTTGSHALIDGEPTSTNAANACWAAGAKAICAWRHASVAAHDACGSRSTKATSARWHTSTHATAAWGHASTTAHNARGRTGKATSGGGHDRTVVGCSKG
jgi:hypothetical protein